MTNLVRTNARGRSRRETRERDHASEHTQIEVTSAAVDDAVLRSVTDAVLALDEPLRDVVVQHYFHGLTTTQIANARSLPVSTVKTRLQRALELIRARIEHEHRDDVRSWKTSLVALARQPHAAHPASHVARTATAGARGLTMTLKAKLALGCALIVAGWLLVREIGSTSGADSRPEVATPALVSGTRDGVRAGESVIRQLEVAQDAVQHPTNERSVSPATPAPFFARPPTLFYGALLGPDGKPIRNAWSAAVTVIDALGHRRYCDAKDEGTFAFHALPFGRYWIEASAFGYRTGEDLIELESTHAQLTKDYALTRMPMLKIRTMTPDGKTLQQALSETPRGRFTAELVPVATKTPPGKWFKEVVGSLNNPFGIGHFWNYGPPAQALGANYMGILLLEQDPPASISLLNFHRVLQTKEVQPGDDEVVFVVSVDDIIASAASIHVQVVDAETRSPIQRARISLEGGPSIGMGDETDANGNVTIEQHEPGEFDMRISADHHEMFTSRILADSGTATDLGTIALEKDITLEADVIDPQGVPRSVPFALGIVDPITHSVAMDQTWGYTSDGAGMLRIQNLGPHQYVVRCAALDAINERDGADVKWVARDLLLDLRSGGAPRNLVIHLEPATRLMLALGTTSPDRLRFRVSDESGRDVVASRFYGRAPRALTLPMGTYRVALLDGNSAVLKEQAVTLGAEATTVDLSR
jgi:hypothetical protein